jgi:hypothetical protein
MAGPGWYRAKFALPDGRPSYSEIYASDKAEAVRIAESMGFGAVVRCKAPGELRPSKIAENAPLGLAEPGVFHAVCYVGFLASRLGTVTAEQLVDDASALHTLAHYLQLGPKVMGGKVKELTFERIRWLENRVPHIHGPVEVEG